MVLISLKAQYVSLIVTVLSGIAELCLFAAALGFNRYAECNALKRGKQVSVRRHSARTKFLAIFAMLVFIVLELFMSFFSDPALSQATQSRRCVAVDRFDLRNGSAFDFTTDAVMFTCFRAEGDRFIQYAGNRSLPHSGPDAPLAEVRCAESALYIYDGEGLIMMPISANQTRSCLGGQCVFSELRGREFRFSEAIVQSEIDLLIVDKDPVSYLVTTLLFDVDGDQVPVIGRRVINAFTAGVNDPNELRRRAFTGSEQTVCPFLLSQEPTVTDVPLPLIYALTASWVLSVLAYAATLLIRRHLFYDMGDPMHWAQRTLRNVDEPFVENPVVTSVYEHGERHMYVSSSSSDEHSFLGRATASLRKLLGALRNPVANASVEEEARA